MGDSLSPLSPQFPIKNTLGHARDRSVRTGEPALVLHYELKFRLHYRSLGCCTFCGFGQIYMHVSITVVWTESMSPP